ncbi:hypothetical protein MHYP_G00025130 [Metynnis hypsauchen]
MEARKVDLGKERRRKGTQLSVDHPSAPPQALCTPLPCSGVITHHPQPAQTLIRAAPTASVWLLPVTATACSQNSLQRGQRANSKPSHTSLLYPSLGTPCTGGYTLHCLLEGPQKTN